jgi:hypothetical protein
MQGKWRLDFTAGQEMLRFFSGKTAFFVDKPCFTWYAYNSEGLSFLK